MRSTPSSRRLARLRKARGRSQAGLARALDVPVQSVYQWENRGVVPNLNNRLRLEAVLGDSIYNLDYPRVSRKVASILSVSIIGKQKKLPFLRFIEEVMPYVEIEADYLDIVEAYIRERWEIKRFE